MNPPNVSMNVAIMVAGRVSASTKEAIENDIAQVESMGDDIASLCRRRCNIRREVGSSVCEKEAAGHSKSEAELVDVANTLQRAISERMRVRGTAKYLQTASVSRLIERHGRSFVRP